MIHFDHPSSSSPFTFPSKVTEVNTVALNEKLECLQSGWDSSSGDLQDVRLDPSGDRHCRPRGLKTHESDG